MTNKKFLFFSLIIVMLLHITLIVFFVLKKPSGQPVKDFIENPIFLKFIEKLPKNEAIKRTSKSKEKSKITPNLIQTPDNLEKKLPLPIIEKQTTINNKPEITKNVNLVKEFDDKIGKSSELKQKKQKLLSEFLPTSGKLTILVYYGKYSFGSTPIGKGYLEVVYPDNNNYKIKLSAKVIGWASIFYSKPLIFESNGTINHKGLNPNLYIENTPSRGESYVKVEKSKKTLFFSSTNQLINYDSDNLQDPLSLIFHLAWLSHKNTEIEFRKLSSFYVFNRKRLKEIKLTADLPEEIVLPGGVLVDAIKIKSTIIEKKRPGIMTFWLDPADNFLPVRISYLSEKSNKTLDFLVLREEEYFPLIEEKNNKKTEIKKNTHPYLPIY